MASTSTALLLATKSDWTGFAREAGSVVIPLTVIPLSTCELITVVALFNTIFCSVDNFVVSTTSDWLVLCKVFPKNIINNFY